MGDLVNTFELTLPQQDIYFEQVLFPEFPIYNIGAKIIIRGPLDIHALKKAHRFLIDQHDAFRISIDKMDERPMIKINSDHDSELELVDFSNSSNPEETANSFMQENFKKPFKFDTAELLHRFVLIRINNSYHYLFSIYHHIITDGWGTSLMFQRLVSNYNELLSTNSIHTSYPFSYRDFINDDKEYQNSDKYQLDEVYWSEKFKMLPDNLIPLIGEKQITSEREVLLVSRTTYNKLNELAQELKVSTFHVLLGILYLCLNRYYNQNDLSIGLPVLNRGKATFKKTVGLFMGVAPLRVEIDQENTFSELVSQIRNQLRKDFRHQRFPLGNMVRKLNLFKEKERLFNVTLSYEKQNYATNFHDTHTSVIPLSHESERVALAIYVREFDSGEDVKIDFDYNKSYFNSSSVVQLIQCFENIQEQLLIRSTKKIKNLNIISNIEQRRLLFDFNNTKAAFDWEKTVVDIFRDQVKKQPEKIALEDLNKSLTYKEIDLISNRIASNIYRSINPNESKNIGVLLDRSADMIIVLLGILKAGYAYIPFDPKFPVERIKYILHQSQCKNLVLTKNSKAQFDIEGLNQLFKDDLMDQSSKDEILRHPKPVDTAYIIYTSGSTGNPKGVEILHQSLLNFLWSMKSKPGISNADKLYAVTTISFDISILEFFLPLISGATLYIANEEILADPTYVIQNLKIVNPSIIQGTPSFYQMLYNASWAGNKKLKVLCGGDALSNSLAKRLIETTKELWNMYGPTETTIWSSTKNVLKPEEATNIGKPINNTSFYLLDEWLRPVPLGAIGELYIGGKGLANGYFLDAELTKGKFMRSPFTPEEKIYKTGDIGKWTAHGEMIFLGRNDNQVKLRGYRIELGEIEKKLEELPEIKQAVVVLNKKDKESVLVAYIRSKSIPDNSTIIESLRKSMPSYMIPQIYVSIDSFPLTPNKKIDRKKLSYYDYLAFKKQVSSDVRILTETEKIVADIWKKNLKVLTLNINDNFFSLGGHSLNGVKIIHSINKEFNAVLKPKDLFDNPTVRLIGKKVEQRIGTSHLQRIPKAKPKEYYDLIDSQFNLWLLSQNPLASTAYHMFGAYKLSGTLDKEVLQDSFRQLVSEHEIFRTQFIEVEGAPKQRIVKHAEHTFTLEEIQYKEDDSYQEIIEEFTIKPFDLSSDILLRVGLIALEPNIHLLIFVTHHIILDGWSIERLIYLISQYYNARIKKSPIPSQNIVQFKDYTEWKLSKSPSKELRELWLRKLDEYRPYQFFKLDHEGPVNSFVGNITDFKLTKTQTQKLRDIAKKHGLSFFNIIFAIVKTLVYQVSKKTDLCLGTVVSGRDQFELEESLGMFVNSLPIRTQFQSSDTFKKLVFLVSDSLHSAMELGTFDNSISEGIESLWYVMVVFQNPQFTVESGMKLEGLEISTVRVRHQTSRFPITFNFHLTEEQLKCDLEYNTSLYQKESMDIIAFRFICIVNAVIENFNIPLNEIDMRFDWEKEAQKNIEIDFNF